MKNKQTNYLPNQNQIIALERRPNSLPESLEQVILPQEFHICNHEVNLRIETAPEIIRVAIAADSILSTVIIEVENILEKIGVLWTQLLDQKQPNEFQRQNLNALAGIVANVNGLDNKFAEILNLVDGGLSSVIDQAIGSLTSVNGLDCDCACPIPKRSIKLIEGTVLATAVDSEKEQQRLRDILKKTADNLQEAIVLGVRNVNVPIAGRTSLRSYLSNNISITVRNQDY